MYKTNLPETSSARRGIGHIESKTPDIVSKITNKDLKPKKKATEKEIFVRKYK